MQILSIQSNADLGELPLPLYQVHNKGDIYDTNSMCVFVVLMEFEDSLTHYNI